MKDLKISVVIPAYNEEKYIRNCLESLNKQDYKKDFEVIVIDNGSTDKTGEIAKSFGVKVIFTPKSNQARARQDGFKMATGEIIATLDADNAAYPNFLSAIAAEFEKDPKLVSIFGFIKPLEGKIVDKILLFIGNFANIISFYLTGHPILVGTNQAIKREVFEKIGGLEPLKLPKIHADIFDEANLMRNLRKAGKIKFVSKMLIFYSMRKFHQIGYFKMFWAGLLAWIDLVFLKKFKFKLPTVRNVVKRKSLIFDQIAFLVVTLAGISLVLTTSPGLIPFLLIIHFLIFRPWKVFFKRVAIAAFVFLIVFLPLTYFWVQNSQAQERITTAKIRAYIKSLNLEGKLRNLTDLELLQLFNREKLQELLER